MFEKFKRSDQQRLIAFEEQVHRPSIRSVVPSEVRIQNGHPHCLGGCVRGIQTLFANYLAFGRVTLAQRVSNGTSSERDASPHVSKKRSVLQQVSVEKLLLAKCCLPSIEQFSMRSASLLRVLLRDSSLSLRTAQQPPDFKV